MRQTRMSSEEAAVLPVEGRQWVGESPPRTCAVERHLALPAGLEGPRSISIPQALRVSWRALVVSMLS